MNSKHLLSPSVVLAVVMSVLFGGGASAQVYNQMDADGTVRQRSERTGSDNFNPNRRDSVKKNKDIPRGLYVWTVDRTFGDIRPAQIDTMPHLYQNSIYNEGLYGQFNTLGNNYTPRQNRIFIDRRQGSEFFFSDPYDYTTRQPDEFHFTNTLSPYTNISYDNCGDKLNGEDHIDAKFAVNANKRLGFGFDLDYNYARGYFQNSNNSHFRAQLFASYIGDRYQMHALYSNYHRKAAESGGITNDDYITHPEASDDQYSEDEIPTVLSRNWNRQDMQGLFLTHRYSVGFYRKVAMTPEEIKAREFARRSAQLNARKDSTATSPAPDDKPEEPEDSTMLNMKREYVPVTSFIHTLDIGSHERIYQAYASPSGYYADSFYDTYGNSYSGDSIFDKYRYLSVKNTFAIALLEGFNKYMKAGLKAFVSYEHRRYQMPALAVDDATRYTMGSWTDHCLNVGGLLSKTQGRTLHFSLRGELGVTGADAGALSLDFATDLNFPLLGDTVRLAASAFFHRETPTFFATSYHSKHLWWEQSLKKPTHSRIEGVFSFPKTGTRLRVAIDEIQNYTYFGVSYSLDENMKRQSLTAGVFQNSGNINLLTAQLQQDFSWRALHWENIVTWQNSSSSSVLPLPALNVFSNLYLKFMIARVLSVELGGCVTFFTKYDAPDYVPQLSQYAVQQNAGSRVQTGGYPWVDVYANMHLKRARFFVAMSHVNAGSGSKNYFLTPHYPTNSRVLHMGVSWNFYN